MASDGRVLGINSAMAGHSQAIGFAIPVETASWVVGELLARGKVKRAYLGVAVRTRPLSPRIKARTGLVQRGAVEVIASSEGSAARRGDLRPGDLIVELNGQSVVDAGSLHRALRKISPAERVKIVILRDGIKHERELVTQ